MKHNNNIITENKEEVKLKNFRKSFLKDIYKEEKRQVVKRGKAGVIAYPKKRRELTPIKKFNEYADIESKYSYFFDLVPEIQKVNVWFQINHYFKGDVDKYIKDRHLFIKHFTKEDKLICDREKEVEKKIYKETLLYSSQLLKLIGHKRLGAQPYLNSSLLNLYNKEIEEQEELLKSLRLIDKDGKFFKLETLEIKQLRQIAEVLNLNSTLAKIAKDRDFEYMLITLTLPPELHSNPQNLNNSFDGTRPLEQLDCLNANWEKIRHRLKKKLKLKDDFFGCAVFEGMADGTPHKHILLYYDKTKKIRIKIDGKYKVMSSKEYITYCVKEVAKDYATENNTRLNFDIRYEDKKKGGSGATYIFKYITKTFNALKDDEDNTGLKNIALRYFFSARAFDFFGIKRVVSKFRYLCKNYHQYSKYLNLEIIEMFKTYDYYTFITKYERYFHTVREDDKIKFIEFDLDGNIGKSFNSNRLDLMFNKSIKRLIIKSNQYNVFEANQEIIDGKINCASHLDKDDIKNKGIFTALNNVIEKEKIYCAFIEQHKEKHSEYVYIELNEEKKDFNLTSEELKNLFYFNDTVPIVLSYSRKPDPTGHRVRKRSVFDLFNFPKIDETE